MPIQNYPTPLLEDRGLPPFPFNRQTTVKGTLLLTIVTPTLPRSSTRDSKFRSSDHIFSVTLYGTSPPKFKIFRLHRRSCQ
ncbi:hypothetical protein FRC03_004377 [Tulasnella sp. 419]|nr:hypothetical protein FRC03_004377 [Tulasnella sp. 419]